jgi:hypothetical protein
MKTYIYNDTWMDLESLYSFIDSLVLFWNRTKIYALEEHSFTFKLRKL